MKKFSLFFALAILVLFSCSKENTPLGVEIEAETKHVTAEDFFEKYSEGILNLTYEEFIQLHEKVQEKAFEVMPVDKKISFWQDKVSRSEDLRFLTKNQKSFLKEMHSQISVGFKGDDVAKENIEEYYLNNWDKEGFSYKLVHNIFEEINPVDENSNTINYANDRAATEEIINKLNENVLNTRNMDNPTITPGGNSLKCSLTSCFKGTQPLCNPYVCTSNCQKQDCGFWGWWTCSYACLY